MRNTAKLAKLSQDDWPCAAMQDILDESTYVRVIEGLDSIVWEEAHKDFYVQREANLAHNDHYKRLFNPHLLQNIRAGMESFFDVCLDQAIDIVAHKMIKGDYIGVHTDMNSHGETHRLTIMLNEAWDSSRGGIFMSLNGKSLATLRDAWLPIANTGFAFEISERSFHAVSPITTDLARYCLILTFKKVCEKPTNPWVPFVLGTDIENAISTASYMGISAKTFVADYEVIHFEAISEFRDFVGHALHNAPKGFSYASGDSINVDHTGKQKKGTDQERISAIKNLLRIPLPIIVHRKDDSFVLVDGSHRLSYAVDKLGHVSCAIFEEVNCPDFLRSPAEFAASDDSRLPPGQ